MAILLERLVATHCPLGEGSIWDSKAQLLYWLDILGHKIFRYDPSTNTNHTYNVDTVPATIVVRKAGGLVIGIPGGIAALTLDEPSHSGSFTELAMPEREIKTNRMNDGKCDPSGRLWVGSISTPRGLANLWRFDADHSPHQMLTGISTSNGLVWSADRKTMYYIDTPTGRVDALDYDDSTGNISNRRTAVTVAPGLGHPDGMTIDAEGMLWVAMWDGAAVLRYNPLTGQQLARIDLPGVRNVTSCAFGGKNLDQLYITTAAGTKDPTAHPEAGNLFLATNLPTVGLEAPEYAG